VAIYAVLNSLNCVSGYIYISNDASLFIKFLMYTKIIASSILASSDIPVSSTVLTDYRPGDYFAYFKRAFDLHVIAVNVFC